MSEQAITKKRMEPGIAVFNHHINNAHQRAVDELVAQWGQDLFDKEIQPFIDDGIMSIFHRGPNVQTMAYVVLVTAYVNAESTQ